MSSSEELFEIAKHLEATADRDKDQDVSKPLKVLGEAARELKSSFSGSWLGYHSRVYYSNFIPSPAGANFSQEWGLKDLTFSSLGSRGSWREYQFDDVLVHIRKRAGNPDLTAAKVAFGKNLEVFDRLKSEIVSVLELEIEKNQTLSYRNLEMTLRDYCRCLKWMSLIAICQKAAL